MKKSYRKELDNKGIKYQRIGVLLYNNSIIPITPA